MNDVLFWLWGPGLLLLAGGIVYYLARHDGGSNHRHRS